MVPYSHQAGVLQDRVSKTLLHVLQPSFSEYFVTKPLNFKGLAGTSQRFCAHCPYLRAEWGKVLICGPERYEPRETTSHQRGASAQLQQANINTVVSKSYSRWRVIPSTTWHELQQRDSQETWRHLVWFAVEVRAQKILVMLQFSLIWGLYSKTRYHLRQRKLEYWKCLSRLNQTKMTQQLQKGWRVEKYCVYYWVHIPSQQILFCSPGNCVLWGLAQRSHSSLGACPLGWTLEWPAGPDRL